MSSVVTIKNLQKKYGKKTVLDGIDLTFQKGEIYGLIGNNGAGKTTMLRIICGLTRATGGEVTVLSEELTSKVRIGLLIERPALFYDMTAFQNLQAKACALGIKHTKEELDALLQLVGLQDTGKKDVLKFSQGMKQRLGIAMAMIGNPDLLVLDEPINGLDPQGVLDVRNILERIHKERNITIIISSHILDELAKIATRFCILNHGKIVIDCTKEQFVKDCGDMDINEYYLQLINKT